MDTVKKNLELNGALLLTEVRQRAYSNRSKHSARDRVLRLNHTIHLCSVSKIFLSVSLKICDVRINFSVHVISQRLGITDTVKK